MKWKRLPVFLCVLYLIYFPILKAQSNILESPQTQLHGQYEPVGHPGRSFTFWYHGEFTSKSKASLTQPELMGGGTYHIEDGQLLLEFKKVSQPEGKAFESPHLESLTINICEYQMGEVKVFALRRAEPRQTEILLPKNIPAICGNPAFKCFRQTDEDLPFRKK